MFCFCLFVCFCFCFFYSNVNSLFFETFLLSTEYQYMFFCCCFYFVLFLCNATSIKNKFKVHTHGTTLLIQNQNLWLSEHLSTLFTQNLKCGDQNCLTFQSHPIELKFFCPIALKSCMWLNTTIWDYVSNNFEGYNHQKFFIAV